jgi:hypothetical protein
VNLDGVYDGVTNLDPDNVGAIFHNRAATPGDSDQVKRTTGAAASSDGVVAANFHGLDANSALLGFNGTTWDRVRTFNNTGRLRVVKAYKAFKVTAATVGLAAAELVASPLADRAKVIIQNLGSRDIWINTTNAVAAANGYLIPAKGSDEFEWDESVDLWAIGDAAGISIRILEEAA